MSGKQLTIVSNLFIFIVIVYTKQNNREVELQCIIGGFIAHGISSRQP